MLEWLFPGTETRMVLGKMAMDNLVYTPLSILIFFTFLSLSQGLDKERLKRDLAKNYLPTLKTSLMVWPLASIVNFLLIPLNFRPLFIGGAPLLSPSSCADPSGLSVIWNAYLSYVKHQKSDAPILPVVMGSATVPEKAA